MKIKALMKSELYCHIYLSLYSPTELDKLINYTNVDKRTTPLMTFKEVLRNDLHRLNETHLGPESEKI